MVKTALLICCAACIGALMRWRIQASLNPLFALPLGTLTVNLVGGFFIGVVVSIFDSVPHLDPSWRIVLITGFLGTFTTFSSFSAETVHMLLDERYPLALATIAAHVVGSLAMTFVGLRFALFFIAK